MIPLKRWRIWRRSFKPRTELRYSARRKCGQMDLRKKKGRTDSAVEDLNKPGSEVMSKEMQNRYQSRDERISILLTRHLRQSRVPNASKPTKPVPSES